MVMGRKMVGVFTSLVLAGVLVISGCGGKDNNASANGESNNPGKGSGKLVVYSALNEDDTVQIQKQFKEDTGIEIEYLRLNSAGEASTRVQAEKNAPKADILVGGSVEFYTPLADQGLLEKYTSPNADGLDTMFNDPDGYWQGWYMGVLAIAMNKERFEKEISPKGVQGPKSWDDLRDPAYKDVLIMPNPATAGSGYIFTATQIFRLGEDKAWDYVKDLTTNVHHYVASGGDVVNLTATGEFLAGMHWAHDIIKSGKKGYPIEAVIPEETAFEIGGAAIIKNGGNTDNAKKFIDWLLTKETQDMSTQMSSRYSVRTDVSPPEGLPAMDALKLVEYDRVKAAEMKEGVIKKFEEFSGGK
ncbi:ABC transporter substrate-binding protein [Paenibacillus dakarensis]|uniref:ABC transporter substrate-binding protein n=1 Tax=Paenibacillus dakarensis TaxID=1527293 RepID=UPI0006D558E9|nr:ABC transporter substrate-binding protein [Paenibacillus dakarensis]